MAALLVMAAAVAGVLLIGDSDSDTEAAATAATTVPAAATAPVPTAPPVTAANINTLQWVRATSPSGRYSIEMPGNPRTDSFPLEIEAGESVTMHVVFSSDSSLTTADRGLFFAEADYADIGVRAADIDNEAALDGVMNGSVGTQGGRITSSQDVDSPYGRARTFSAEFSDEGLVGAGWVTLDGTNVIQVYMITDAGGEVVAREVVARAVRSLQG